MPGAQSFAVHDPDAELALTDAALDERGEARFGLGDCHAVKIDFCLNTEAAASEFAHGSTAYGCALKAKTVGVAVFHGVDVAQQALAQHLLAVSTGEAGPGPRLLHRRVDA